MAPHLNGFQKKYDLDYVAGSFFSTLRAYITIGKEPVLILEHTEEAIAQILS